MISLTTPRIYNINKRVNNNVSFGTVNKTECDPKHKNILYKNNTIFFRDDINWGMLINYLLKNESINKIHCYACSDGSEPYSIAMALISELGYEKAQKYFPIVARDIDKALIDKANTGVITVTKKDMQNIERYQKKSDIAFFDKKSYPTEDGKICRVSDELRKCVDFGLGNLVVDSAYADYDNSAVFFRNVWPYLSEKEIKILMTNLSGALKDNSMLIMGEYDINKFAVDNDDRYYFEDLAWKYGCYETRPLIYRKIKSGEDLKIKAKKDYLITAVLCELYKTYYYYKRMIKKTFEK